MAAWRRAPVVLLSAPGMAVPAIAKATFTSEDRAGGVAGNVTADAVHRRVRRGAAGAGIEVVKIPPRSPSAYAERWVRTVGAEVTGTMLIAGPGHLRAILDEHAGARQPPSPAPSPEPAATGLR